MLLDVKKSFWQRRLCNQEPRTVVWCGFRTITFQILASSNLFFKPQNYPSCYSCRRAVSLSPHRSAGLREYTTCMGFSKAGGGQSQCPMIFHSRQSASLCLINLIRQDYLQIQAEITFCLAFVMECTLQNAAYHTNVYMPSYYQVPSPFSPAKQPFS